MTKIGLAIVINGILFAPLSAWAEGNSCDTAAREARNRCAQALREASILSAAPTTPTKSVNEAATTQMMQSSLQSSRLNAAKEYCKRQLAQCNENCQSPAAGPGNSNPSGQGVDDLADKSPSYRAAHARCLDRGTRDCNTPLVLQLGDTALKMTAPKDGVLFDVRGERAKPAHIAQRVSWPDRASRSSHFFLALPDTAGEIRGINELFGNHTRGPDRKFADNGWHALAKYDLNNDGVIDKKDAVFAQLRLWSDGNGDGIAGKDEIHTLAQKQVELIDLRFDDVKPDVDRYGNQMALRSAVSLTTGQSKPIFDLIFAP